jgi:hypothetical protein
VIHTRTVERRAGRRGNATYNEAPQTDRPGAGRDPGRVGVRPPCPAFTLRPSVAARIGRTPARSARASSKRYGIEQNAGITVEEAAETLWIGINRVWQ